MSTPPGLDETRAYVGSIGGAVYASDLRVPRKGFQGPAFGGGCVPRLKWQYKTSRHRIMYQPVSTGKVVVVASADASLYGLDAANRRMHFQFETDQPLSAPITQIGEQIFVATGVARPTASTRSRAANWELLSGLRIRQTPRVGGGLCLPAA